MGSFSDYWENKIQDTLFNKAAWTEVTIWVGVCTSDTELSDSATPSEPTAASYCRQDTSAATWTTSASGLVENTLAIEFTVAAQSWCTIYGFAGYDATVAGNVLFCGTLTTARDVTANDSVRFASGALDVALD